FSGSSLMVPHCLLLSLSRFVMITHPILRASCFVRQPRNLHHWPHFDSAFSCARNLLCNLDCLVEIARFDHEITAELLARFSERAIGDDRLAVAHAHARRARDRLQRAG